jgi:hypothetical protein
MTQKDWHDLLYSLGLVGQPWLFVDRVGEGYITWKRKAWPTSRFGAEEWGPISDEKLLELLADPRANLSESHQRLIAQVLHHIVDPEMPLPPTPRKLTARVEKVPHVDSK